MLASLCHKVLMVNLSGASMTRRHPLRSVALASRKVQHDYVAIYRRWSSGSIDATGHVWLSVRGGTAT
jgi:hypothetical protein